MNGKKAVAMILILFVLASLAYLLFEEKKPDQSNPAGTVINAPSQGGEEKAAVSGNSHNGDNSPLPLTGEKNGKLIVYYFYNNVRCESCLKIEKYTKSALEEKFSAQLKDGDMEWQMVNVDEPENKHFVNDYKLITKSVVLSEVKDGKEISHKNLDKVWELLGDEDIFRKYIKDEINDFSGGKV